MAPQVRDLNALIAQQTKALQPQLNLIDQSIAANDQSGQAQIAGLDAKKTQAFGNIEQAAQDKGMFFSGFSPDEQANYTSTTYLPALAELQGTIANARTQLLGKKADLNKTAFDTAFQTREGDINAKRTWDAAETQRQWESKQAELDRSFKAQESARDRAAAAAQAATQANVSAAQAFDADRKAMSSELFQVTGNDGFVSPDSYRKAKNNWVGAGYDAKTFDSYYASFRNPKNPHYKLG